MIKDYSKVNPTDFSFCNEMFEKFQLNNINLQQKLLLH